MGSVAGVVWRDWFFLTTGTPRKTLHCAMLMKYNPERSFPSYLSAGISPDLTHWRRAGHVYRPPLTVIFLGHIPVLFTSALAQATLDWTRKKNSV